MDVWIWGERERRGEGRPVVASKYMNYLKRSVPEGTDACVGDK